MLRVPFVRPVLKGNVHGLGMKEVAPALYAEGARYFFIEELSEGIELREILPYPGCKYLCDGRFAH